MKRLVTTVLIFEAIIVGLAVPVAVHINHLQPGSAAVAAGVTAGAAVIFAILARPLLPATLIGGSILQVFVIAAGVIVPVMYFLGAIFALLWAIGIWLGRRIERPAAP